MTVWQRRLRLAVAVFGLIVSVVVFLAIRRRDPVSPPIKPDRTDEKAQSEIAKGHITSTKGAKTDFRIDFDRMLNYADGTSRFIGVTVNVDERGGRSFVLKGREADVGPNRSWVVVKGAVKLAVSDGLTAETDEASYTEAEGIVRAPGKVTFERERMKGSGVGMTYDKTRDVLWLLDQAEVTLEPDDKGQGTLDITAGAAGFARPDKYMKFERHVKMVRDGRIIEADDATAHLSDDEKHVTALELRGNSRITPPRGRPGSLQQLAAAEMDLGYAPDSEILQRATLARQSVIQLAGERGGRGSRIAAEAIDLSLGPDGTTLASLTARDNVQTDFAAARGQPSRTVRAVSLDGRGEPGLGLTAATFADNVEYRETIPGRPPVLRTVRARRLEAVLNPSTAALEEGKFSGAVRFDEGQMTATAAIARYSVADGTVDLSGVEGVLRPVVADERIRIEARAIQLTPEGPRMVASNDVRTTMQPARKKGAPAGQTSGAGAHMPGMLAQDEPVSVTGDHLDYDGGKSHAVYTGNARLWQGETSINGNTLTLDNEKGNLTVAGTVRTTWSTLDEKPGLGARGSGLEAGPSGLGTRGSGLGAGPSGLGTRGSGLGARGSVAPTAGSRGVSPQTPNPPSPTSSPQPPVPSPQPPAPPAKTQTLSTADQMQYDDAARRVTYTGTAPGTAHVVGAQGDLTAAKIELYLKKDDNGIDRVEAYDKVTVKIDKRVSTGNRLTFFAADERYVMTGSPVKIVECGDENTGQLVTFYKSTDTVFINGGPRRFESKSRGGKCP